MGLTSSSVGMRATEPAVVKRKSGDKVIALAGNPNVGKSTVFNGLTGMKQHTGNWPGKTVVNAQGRCTTERHSCIMMDIPGAYSLMAHSAEEEVARSFICFGEPDAVVVVCDATCLERNLNLALQTMETGVRVVLCVNLMDEAARKGVKIDLPLLAKRLGVPVVGTTARKKRSLNALLEVLDGVFAEKARAQPYRIQYPEAVETALRLLEPAVEGKCGRLDSRWVSLRLLDGDAALLREMDAYLGRELLRDAELNAALTLARAALAERGVNGDKLKDLVVSALMARAEALCAGVVARAGRAYAQLDRKLDKILTSRLTGYPVMLGLLAVVLWLTMAGANYPSSLIADGLFWVQDRLTELFLYLNAPAWLHGLLVMGAYRVLAWVVSVMLPPMAIFFPLFTLLEDAGYLPRVAYDLDKPFKRCNACGKQALCMCMGFGCNAAGVTGCRIIDSPRERLLAILTNSFVPCNGRFPMLIALLTMFFVGTAGGLFPSLFGALLLSALILLGILLTFAATKLLSQTLLRGVPSSFTLELPPYRKPQLGQVVLRSLLDRTLFVLGRAMAVAAPAGALLWLMANITINDISILSYCADFLDPFARLMGLDGVILMAFVLGSPANEIVLPIILMAYMQQGSIMELESLAQMKALLVQNGWTWSTAVSVMLFSLNHWPCTTTLLTIKKETGSRKWMGVAAALPTAAGVALCMAFTAVVRLFT